MFFLGFRNNCCKSRKHLRYTGFGATSLTLQTRQGADTGLQALAGTCVGQGALAGGGGGCGGTVCGGWRGCGGLLGADRSVCGGIVVVVVGSKVAGLVTGKTDR